MKLINPMLVIQYDNVNECFNCFSVVQLDLWSVQFSMSKRITDTMLPVRKTTI